MAALFQQTITGMDLKTLAAVLWHRRGQIHWRYFPRLAYLAVLAGFNSYTALLEKAVDGAKIAAAEPVAPPIIILGYWRSGTTHLHNLMNCDPDLTCPTAYQVMFPHHFVYSQPWGAKMFDYLAPSKRPMDNVAFHGTTPHEEEIALAGLTGVSPYLRVIFPAPAEDPCAALDPAQLPAPALAQWQEAFRLFIKKLSFSKGKRIVLKSPPHLGRIPQLLKLFPGAKFIHILRNPYEVYLSFWKVWRVGHEPSHLRKPDYQYIDELILSWYEELFALFERDRRMIPAGDLHELRFEDLVASPRECLADMYEKLGLPAFERFWLKASAYLNHIADYQKGRYTLTEEVRAKVNQRWGFFFQRYGYPLLPPLKPGASLSLG